MNSIRELSTSIPVIEAYLIGSYAKGNYTASSDIDVLVVVEREEPDTYKKIYKTIRVPRLELLLYSNKEYTIMTRQQPKTIEKLLESAVKIV